MFTSKTDSARTDSTAATSKSRHFQEISKLVRSTLSRKTMCYELSFFPLMPQTFRLDVVNAKEQVCYVLLVLGAHSGRGIAEGFRGELLHKGGTSSTFPEQTVLLFWPPRENQFLWSSGVSYSFDTSAECS